MLITSIINKLRVYLLKKSFKRQCTIGTNFSLLPSARCVNKSGDKNSIVIGNNVEICGSLYASQRGHISIGENTTIRHNTEVISREKIHIGNRVIISNWCIISDNNNHPTDPDLRKQMSDSGFYGELWDIDKSESSPIIIEDNVWIGQRSMILKGVRIGKGAIVAAGAVVTHNVPDYVIVAGNPAVVVKKIR